VLRSGKGGKSGIYIRVTIGRKPDYYATGNYVDEKNFDAVSGLVKGDKPNIESINQQRNSRTSSLQSEAAHAFPDT
jgi:hypothetical protein